MKNKVNVMNQDEVNELIQSFSDGVRQLRVAIAGMPASAFHERPVAGKWSTHEVICHLVDFEIINADRIKRVIAEESPLLNNAEPDPFAASLAYDCRDTEKELNLIEAIRGHLVVILKSLSLDQWDRIGVHSTAGQLTLAQLVKRTSNHIPHHLPFIAEKRKLLGV